MHDKVELPTWKGQVDEARSIDQSLACVAAVLCGYIEERAGRYWAVFKIGKEKGLARETHALTDKSKVGTEGQTTK